MKGFVLFSTLLITLVATAGPVHVGNGGNAIKISDELYLLDLAEQGIAQEPSFKPVSSNFFYQYFRSRTLAYPNRIPAATLDLFSEKLAEVAELDPVYAEALITAFENVRWMFVNYRLNDIPVESIIAGPYFQVAARTNDVILFDVLYWQQMNEANRVALIFHELNYILIYPKREAGQSGAEKSALKARLQTGYLFTENLQHVEPNDFSRRIQNWFPSRFSAKFNNSLTFFPFTFKLKNETSRMAFNPFLMINGNYEGPNIANMTRNFFRESMCKTAVFEFKTVEIYGLSVVQDVFDGDNNSQDVTTFENTKVPGFLFQRGSNESCNDASDRLYTAVGQQIPGVFYTEQ